MGIKKRMLDPVSVESSCYNSYPLFSFAVSAVGTRIGRRTSSRRATSDAGGARLSEAGESDQLTERGREKEKHEFHEHRAFFATFSFSFFFFFFCLRKRQFSFGYSKKLYSRREESWCLFERKKVIFFFRKKWLKGIINFQIVLDHSL